MKKVITHNGGFHADDVFAVATLQLYFGVDEVAIVRTRDEAMIASGDIVLDVGGVYDPDKQRFDHHQNGAPVRDNGIPYAAFGLIWKHYGERVAGGSEAAARIEQRLVLPIDAVDNAVAVYEQKFPDFSPFTVQDIIGLMKPVWNGEEEMNDRFQVACAFAREVLQRAKSHAEAELAEVEVAAQAYESAPDKKIIVSDTAFSPHFLTDHKEVLVTVFPDDNAHWKAVAMREGHDSFATKVRFPETWRGLRENELARASGIPDAIFCHKSGHLFVAKSQAGAMKAAEAAVKE